MRLINADALKEQFKDKEGDAFTAFHFYETIDNAPTIEERKTGRWKAKDFHTCYCTNCTFAFDIMKCDFMDKMKFCPNCGANMEGEDE